MSRPTDDADQQARAWQLESRGIDYVPHTVRWGRPRDVGAMWAGSSVQFEYLVYGAVLMTFGVTFRQAVVVILIGNLSYLLLGLCSLQGPQAGTTVFAINRAPFGPNGSRVVALLNWLTQVGFETEGLVLVVLAGEALAVKAGIRVSTALEVALVVGAAAVQGVLPALGHATVVKVLRAAAVPFAALYVVLAALTLGRVRPDVVRHAADWQTFMVALAFTIPLAGLGWVECGNDYSRYLPADTDSRSLVWWVTVGGGVPQILMMLLGAAVATYVPSAADDPLAAFPRAFPAWFLVPFLVVVIVQLFAINSLDLYSSGVTLQALGLRIARWQAVVVDTVVSGGLTAYAVLSSSFENLLGDFADLMIVWIAPWMAVFLVDWLLRRRSYAPEELQRTDAGGLYWRSGGFHWPAVIAQAAGMAAALVAVNQTFFTGPLARATGGADLSVFTGVLAAAAVYLLLAHRGVRREATAQEQLVGGISGISG